jgi:signal transduction histidine kinase
MESKLLLAAVLSAAAGAAAGYAWARRAAPRPPAPPPEPGAPGEDRMVWLQRLSTVGQMMSGVLHEVRTPLNTVILTVEHAQRVLDRGGNPSDQLKTVAREADRAVEILSEMLDFAKPAALDLKPLPLSDAIHGALDPLKIRFDERGVETSVDAPAGLTVLASERHLHQVLTILLINALDAMPFGGRLDVAASRTDGTARVTLTDTGVGIEPQALRRLFQPFATGRPAEGGTGLGLNVARWIMAKHGGDVAIASPGIGKGTTVTLTLKSA